MPVTTEIHKFLSRLNLDLDKSNSGLLIGECYKWDEVIKYAKAKSDEAWAALDKSGLIPDTSTLEPGQTHTLCDSPLFSVTARLSEPVRRFDPKYLSNQLNKKYKVPVPIAREMIEAAKLPTKPTVTYMITEKS